MERDYISMHNSKHKLSTLESILTYDQKQKLETGYYGGDDKEDFARRVGLLIEMSGSPKQLAEITQLKSATIRKWARGESEPKRPDLLRLSMFKNFSLKWLISGKGSIHEELNAEKEFSVLPDSPQVSLLKEKVADGQAFFTYIENNEMMCCIEKFDGSISSGPYALRLGNQVEVRSITIVEDEKCLISQYEWSDITVDTREMEISKLKQLILGRVIWISKTIS